MSMLLLNSRRGLAVARAISLGCRIMSSTPKAATTVESSLSATQQEQHATAAVYFDHDGGNDDFVALCYLLKHEHRFDLLGVSVTPANSWEGAGTRATRKILRTFSNKHCSSSPFSSSSTQGKIPVAESTLRGVNAFPDAWRHDACRVNLLPQLNGFETEEQALRLEEGMDDPSNARSGQLLLAQTLLGSESKVTVIATGPLTNLAWVLDNHPEASSKIDKVLIMGGAIDVPGNVFADDVKGFDGTAEWNIFWDPWAAKRVWDSSLQLVLTPLDATDEVPITKETLLRLSRQNHCASSTFVGSIWAMAGAHLMETKSRPFFAWDLLTVAQLVHPELFTTSELECDVVVEGASQGRIVRTAGNSGRGTDKSVYRVFWYILAPSDNEPQQRQPPKTHPSLPPHPPRPPRPPLACVMMHIHTSWCTGGDDVGSGRTVTVIRARDADKLVDVILTNLCSSCDGADGTGTTSS
ncbi:unnamed protein product [Pylaiella littoralis]